MSTLNRNNYSGGWSPASDGINGPKNILLRMDNLHLDEIGNIAIARGTNPASNGGFPASITNIYSRTFKGSDLGSGYPQYSKVRYVACANGSVYRNYDPSNKAQNTFGMGFMSGGDPTYATFATAWGHVLGFSGVTKRKDRGDVQHDLGIPANNPPGVSLQATTQIDLSTNFNSFVAIEGTNATNPGYVQSIVNANTNRGIVQFPANGGAYTQDLTNFGTGTGNDSPNDLFKVLVRPTDTSRIVKVRVEFLLNTPQSASTTPDVTDYYWFEWLARDSVDASPDFFDPNVYSFTDRQQFIDDIQNNLVPGITFESFFRVGPTVWGTLQTKRSQFNRVGTDGSLDWKSVKGIRLTVITTDPAIDIFYSAMRMESALLQGQYSYIQVDVRDTGQYLEMGQPSPASETIQAINAGVQVSPTTVNGQANQCWIFRSSTSTPGYYLCKILTGADGFAPSPFVDNLTDVDVLRIALGTPGGLGVLRDYQTPLPDNIIAAIGPYYDKMIYFTYDSMYVSYNYDPSCCDSRFVFLIAATEGEIILWARNVIDGLILVGTTNDIYAIQGDFTLDNATQTLNVSIKSLAIEQVPVSSANTVYGTSLIYMSGDGWRVLEGSTTYLLSQPLALLYNNYTRFGIPPVRVPSRNSSLVYCCVSKNRLICSVEHLTIGRALHIYNFENKYWRFWTDYNDYRNAPLSIYAEEDDTVLFGTSADGNNILYEFDTGSLLYGSTKQAINLTTIYDDDNLPYNRKDGFTLKLLADGDADTATITVNALTDGDVPTPLVFNSTVNGEVKFDIRSLGPVKKYQLSITGNFQNFVFRGWAIEYDARPTQLTSLRIPPESFGTSARKRLPQFPVEIDTLGNNVQMTVTWDGVSDASVPIFTIDKNIYEYRKGSDNLFTVRSIILSAVSGFFEFYGLPQPKELQILPESVTYKKILSTNLGSPNKKRVRTWPFAIDAKGNSFSLIPKVDSVTLTTQTYTGYNGKRTYFYYFTDDIFGIDYEWDIIGGPLEIYEPIPPTIVEVLPVGKRFDQIGPINLGRQGNLRLIRFRILAEGSSINYTLYNKDVQILSSSFVTTPNKEVDYEINYPLGTKASILRIELSSSLPFYRRESSMRALPTGKDTDLTVLTL